MCVSFWNSLCSPSYPFLRLYSLSRVDSILENSFQPFLLVLQSLIIQTTFVYAWYFFFLYNVTIEKSEPKELFIPSAITRNILVPHK